MNTSTSVESALLTEDVQHWLFQGNPQTGTNIQEMLSDMEIGEQFAWKVNQQKNDIRESDLMMLWQSGNSGGLMAFAVLVSDPYRSPETAEQLWVDCELVQKLEYPITRSQLLTSQPLKEMKHLKFYQNTNYPVTNAEWRAVLAMVDVSNLKMFVETDDDDCPEHLKELVSRVFMKWSDVVQLEDLVWGRRQVILEGPPGSGKTFIADKFARYFTGNPLEGEHDERIEFVQFHQSYGYEDFVQGIRPKTDPATGHLRYDVQDGIFLEMCARARADPDNSYVLIIDEINRGNLSRIFGELLMALEYRDKKVRLPYGASDGSGETAYITIPENLYLIGTMNSTDRSLAMIDYALRRRFYFYPLRPVVDGAAPVLQRWMDSQPDFDQQARDLVMGWFLRINHRICGDHGDDFQIGHSYFMNAEIGEAGFREQIWRYSLLPLLNEYYHGHRDHQEVITLLAPSNAPVQIAIDERSALSADDV